MSVWNNLLPNYKGETIYKLSCDIEAELLKKFSTLFDYSLGGDNTIFKEHIAGDRKKMLEDRIEFTLDFADCNMTDVYMYALLRSHDKWHTGLKGSYMFYNSILNGDVIIPKISRGHINEIASATFKVMGLNSHLNPKDVDDFATNFLQKVKIKEHIISVLDFLKHVKSLRNLHSFRRTNTDIMRNGPTLYKRKSGTVTRTTPVEAVNFNFYSEKMYCEGSAYKITFYKGLYFFIAKEKQNNSFVFNSKEISRLINYMDSLLGAYLHADYKCNMCDDPVELTMLNAFIKYINSLDSYTVHAGAEAWISGVKAMKCFLAGPLAMNSYKESIADRNSKGHDKICPMSILTKLTTGKSAEYVTILGSVARVAMPPDFDVPKMFTDEKDLHKNKNKIGAEISEEAEITYQNFLKYNRYAFINQFYKRYRVLPGRAKDASTDFGKAYNKAKSEGKRLKLTYEQAHMVDLTGCLKYKSRDLDYFMYFKDTSMARETVAENLKDDYNKFEESNQIGHMLFAKERIDVIDYKTKFVEAEHPIRVACKVEASKADGRLFFIYNLKDKILKAELEENVHEFLTHVPGNAVGMPSVKLRKQMLNIIQMGTEEISKISPIFLSDDISKWSPHMPKRVQQDSADFWAEVFDEKWVHDIEKIDINDQVICNIMGYVGKYNSDGANKEGSSGKRITYLMINLKAFATAVLRGKFGGPKIVEGSARLLTFLDDGFTQVDVNSETFNTDAPKVIQGYANIQKMCGYELKISKSYPSDRYLTFLNYEYHCKRRLYDELKSTTKLFVRKVGEVMTLAERLRECSSWAVGAAESGSDAGFVYYMYIYRCIYELSNWSDKKLVCTPIIISQLVAPIQYGGFGLVPIHGIIAGLIRNLTAECLETLKRYAIHEPSAKHIYCAVLQMIAHPKSGIAVFRTPGTLSIDCKHLTESRIVKAIEKVFIENTESAYISEFVHLSNRAAFKDWAESLVDNNFRIAYTSLELIYNSTTVSFIDSVLSKCKKSASLIDLLGQKELNALIRANVNEARDVIETWNHYLSNF